MYHSRDLFGLILGNILVLPNLCPTNNAKISKVKVKAIIIIVLSTGTVALFIYYYGLNKLPASHTTLFELFWPLSAVIIDWVKNGEPLSMIQILGAIMLLSSVTLLTQENSHAKP